MGDKKDKGFWFQWTETWVSIIVHPVKFFSSMPSSVGIIEPFIFASVLFAVYASIPFVFGSEGTRLIGSSGGLPIFLEHTCFLFLISLYFYIFIYLFKGKKKFASTFAVVAYSHAVFICKLIPTSQFYRSPLLFGGVQLPTFGA